MRPLSRRSARGVRPRWLKAIVDAVQVAGGRVSVTPDAREARAVLEQFIASLPTPQRPIEELMLNGLLLEFAVRSGVALHERVHGKDTRRCGFTPALAVERAWGSGDVDGRQAFATWVHRFCAELSRTHQPSTVRQVAAIVRDRFSETWGVGTLARRFRTTPARLRLEFRHEYGMSIHDYQRVVRTLRALDRLADEKVEAVAYAVGYRSKKNFYRAFQAVTGRTLDAYRRLSPEGAVRVRGAVARLVSDR
jgi:AraC-like DNA-binding protein